MSLKLFICLIWFCIIVIIIMWNYACTIQYIKTAKIWNSAEDKRHLMGYTVDGSVSKNQNQSKSLQDRNVYKPIKSVNRNVTELRKLSDLVKRRLFYLQNPKNCTTARKVICRPNRCGFGSGLHHFTFCLLVAYATGRTLILNSTGWRYTEDGWESLFLPVSTNCTSTMKKEWMKTLDLKRKHRRQEIYLDEMKKLFYRPDYMPFAIPADIADRLERVHRNPAVWWIGQLVDYLFRPNKKMKLYIKTQQDKLVFRRPIVGIHVRRTDKIIEANYFSLKEYMTQVDTWFNQHMKNRTQTRYVFIATDKPNIIDEAKRKYPNYTFVYHKDAINMTKHSRYSMTSLRGLLADVHTLAKCDFVVCTMSSNVCRLVLELKESRSGRGSEQLMSLDTDYVFNNIAPGKTIERLILKNETSGPYLKGLSIIKDKRKSPFKPMFTADNPRSRVVMPVYPEVVETV